MLDSEYQSTIKGRQPSTGWMAPLSRGLGLQFPGLSRLVAADEGPWKVLLSLNPLFQVLSKPGSIPAASLPVCNCRSWGSTLHLPGPVALGPNDLYGLLSGLAFPSPEDQNCSQDNLWSSVEVPAGPGGTVLSWEVSCLPLSLPLSPRLPTGSSIPDRLRGKKPCHQISEPLSFFSQEEQSTQEEKSAK